MSKKLTNKEGVLVVRVVSAGIGRMRFKAFLPSERLERVDGGEDFMWQASDEEARRYATYDTPGEALKALADRLDKELAATGWDVRVAGNEG